MYKLYDICGPACVFFTVLSIHVRTLKQQKYVVDGEKDDRFWDVKIVMSHKVHGFSVQQYQQETNPREFNVILTQDEE